MNRVPEPGVSRRRAAVAVTGFLCAAGCAAHRTTSPTATGTAGPATTTNVRTMTASPTSTASRTLTRRTLTMADNDSSVITDVGTSLVVTLTPQTGMWRRPAFTRSSVLRTESVTGAYPSPGPLRFRARAVTPGRTGITTTTDLPCFHATPPCAPPQWVWRVQVIVR